MIQGHGDDYQGELKANFSSNVWYAADNAALKLHLYQHMHLIDRYPEPQAASLGQRIARSLSISSSELLVTNGSVEAFYLIAQAFEGAMSVIKTPTFSEYADACKLYSHVVLKTNNADFNELIQVNSPQLVWICNPNNPDGTIYSVHYLRQLLEQNPQTIFVIDQAYSCFTTYECLNAADIRRFPNLILIQSLTKRYAIPGLRLGYVLANETLIKGIAALQQPWTVNALAIEAGKFLHDGYQDDFDLKAWLAESQRLQKAIDGLDCFDVIPTDLPYFLVALRQGNAAQLKEFLLQEKLLVRDATNFEGLSGEYIRVCALSALQNNLLLEQLGKWNQEFTQS